MALFKIKVTWLTSCLLYIWRVDLYTEFRSICSETKRQNPQTAVSEEPTGIHRSKRPRVAYCRLREFSNRTRLDNKTGGEPNEREMKCDNEAV